MAAPDVAVEIRDELRRLRELREEQLRREQAFQEATALLLEDMLGDLVHTGQVSPDVVDALETALGQDLDVDVREPNPNQFDR